MRVVACLSFFHFGGVIVVVVVVYNDSSIRSFILNKVGFSAPPAPPPPWPPPCVVQIYENMNTRASARDSYISNQERGRYPTSNNTTQAYTLLTPTVPQSHTRKHACIHTHLATVLRMCRAMASFLAVPCPSMYMPASKGVVWWDRLLNS